MVAIVRAECWPGWWLCWMRIWLTLTGAWQRGGDSAAAPGRGTTGRGIAAGHEHIQPRVPSPWRRGVLWNSRRQDLRLHHRRRLVDRWVDHTCRLHLYRPPTMAKCVDSLVWCETTSVVTEANKVIHPNWPMVPKVATPPHTPPPYPTPEKKPAR